MPLLSPRASQNGLIECHIMQMGQIAPAAAPYWGKGGRQMWRRRCHGHLRCLRKDDDVAADVDVAIAGLFIPATKLVGERKNE